MTGMVVGEGSVSLKSWQTATVTAAVIPEGADPRLSASSSAEGVATVSVS